MKLLLGFLKEHKFKSILAPAFKLLEAVFDLLIPLITADIIDNGVATGDRGYIISRCALMVALGLIGLACSITAQYFAADAATSACAGIRHRLFERIQTLSFSQTDKLGTGTLVTRMTSDVNQVQNGLNLFLRLFLRSPFIVFGAMILAFTVDVKAATAFAVVIPLLAAVVFAVMLRSLPMYGNVQTKLDRLTVITRENLNGVRVVRAFGREKDETERFAEADGELMRGQINVGFISAILNPATYMLVNLAVIAVLMISAGQVDGGIIAQGGVVALVNYMSQILVELIKLANLTIQLTRASACAGRIDAVLRTEPDMNYGEIEINRDIETAVEFKNVSLRYGNSGKESLSDISFKIGKGQTVGIIGGTGSGKTSLVSLIPRFYDATGGTVMLFGRDVRDYGEDNLRGCVGTVMQSARLFSGTLRDNLKWGNKNADDGVLWDALKTAQADGFVREKGGLDIAVGQNGRNFSGGQRQRLSIARTLVSHPRILILDDSSSALDYATDAALRAALAALPDDITVFTVSQRAGSIMGCDIIIVLDGGEIAGIGTHDSLMSDCSVYRDIYESQFEKEGV